MNQLLSFKLNRVYLDPLNISNAGDFSWSWILNDFTQALKDEGKCVVLCLRPPYIVKLEMYFKAWCTCRTFVLIIKPIVFWSRRCGRRRLGCFKLPNLPICTDCFTCMRFSILLGTTVPTFLAALGLRKMHPGTRGRVQKFVMLESIRGFIHYYYFLANNSWITTQQLNNSINISLNYHWNISKCLETS